MKNIDWIYIRIPAIVFLVSMVLATVLFTIIDSYHSEAALQYSSLDQAHISVKRKFEEARRNRALYQQYLVQYKRLQEKGVIGEEKRLSWIEELQNINKKYLLSGLNYEISPQRGASLPKVTVSKNVKVNVSTMQLNAGLLHEGDVVSLWRDLRQNAKGLFALSECEFESSFRRDQPVTYSPYMPNVRLDCELNWYSILAKAS